MADLAALTPAMLASVKVEGRSSRARLSLACRAVALIVFVIGVLQQSGPRTVALCLALGLLVLPLAWRQRADVATGALYSASADRVETARRWPGQLSVTRSSVSWMPSSYSLKHGLRQVDVPASEEPVIKLRRGPAVMDLTLTVKPVDEDEHRFVTRRSRRLQQALSAIEKRSADP
jgi:hypothetical protein